MASSKKQKTLRLVELALLVAIEILMSFTPLGYLKTPLIEITFMMIPVAIAAIMIGPIESLIVGTVFGITSFIQCFGMSSFGVAMMAISPFRTALVCLVPRILTGLLAGLIFRALSRKNPRSFPAVLVTSFSAAALNTILFVSLFFLCFHNASLVIGESTFQFAGMSIFDLFGFLAGVNGLIEAGVCTVVGTAIGKPLLHLKAKI